jgi:uncharacterized protein YcfJ
MNNIATAILAGVLAVGSAFGAWRAGVLGPQYAQVLRSTPITVQEPLFVDVVDVVPVAAAGKRHAGKLGYDVAYRVGNRILRTRVASEPGDQVRIGERRRVIGYDVSWRYRNRTGVVRMSSRPGRRLPVVDGAIVEAVRSWPAGPG